MSQPAISLSPIMARATASLKADDEAAQAKAIAEREAAKATERVEKDRWESARNVRGAAALNYLETCRVQGGRNVWTDRDYQLFLIIVSAGDEAVRFDQREAIVPAGFGPAVRHVQDKTLDAVAEALRDIGNVEKVAEPVADAPDETAS